MIHDIRKKIGVKLPTIWIDEKHRREEKSRRKKMQVREKVEKSRNTFFSTDLWKVAGAEPFSQR